MNKMIYTLGAAVAFVGVSVMPAIAGPPFTNIEGVGGVALNPLAFVANGVKSDDGGLFGSGVVSKPNLGYWHIGLEDSDIDWEAVGGNISFFNMIEIGYGHEFVSIDDVTNVDKNNYSMKVNFLPEGEWYPALAVGGIYKDTSFTGNADDSGVDYYAVASKHFMDIPTPIVLSAGVVSTEGYVRGVLGFGEDRDEAFFGNFEILPTMKMDVPDVLKGIIIGVDYLGSTDVGNNHETNSIWNAHVAWMNDGLTLIAAYVDSGSDEVRDLVNGMRALPPSGFGDGWCISMQYAF
jgi:hypothetical protein